MFFMMVRLGGITLFTRAIEKIIVSLLIFCFICGGQIS